MNFTDAISTCFTKYADFTGRAKRAEYWWFVLFMVLVSLLLHFVVGSGLLRGLFSLATIIPYWAVGARRLHDTDRSGWWQLLVFVPIIGWIFLLIWKIQDSDEGTNRFDSIA